MHWLWPALLVGTACSTSGPSKTTDAVGVEVPLSSDSGEPSGDDTAPPDEEPPPPDPDEDGDDDGYTIDDGDCDDTDDTVHPGATDDTCDGIDQDCDGTADQDVADAHEPNDIEAYPLGNLSEIPETILSGMLSTDSDVDIFSFEIDDVFAVWFSIEVELDGLPSDIDAGLQLLWVTGPDGAGMGLVAEANEELYGQSERIRYTGDGLGDDSGTYEVIVHSIDGSNCSTPYSLAIRTRQPPWE